MGFHNWEGAAILLLGHCFDFTGLKVGGAHHLQVLQLARSISVMLPLKHAHSMCDRLKYNWSFFLILLHITSDRAMHSIIIVVILIRLRSQGPVTLWMSSKLRLILCSQETRELGWNALDSIWKMFQWYFIFYLFAEIFVKSRSVLVKTTVVWRTLTKYIWVICVWFVPDIRQAIFIALFFIFVIWDLSGFLLVF